MLKCTYHFSFYLFAVDGTPFLQSGQVGPPAEVRTGDGSQLQAPFTKRTRHSVVTSHRAEPKILNFSPFKRFCQPRTHPVDKLSKPRRRLDVLLLQILASPGYPLPICHFDPKQLLTLERKTLPTMFARCGFNRNTSLNILFGPTRFNGAGFRPFSTEQGVGQLQLFVKHWSSSMEIGRLLRVAVSRAQLNVGVSYSVFENVTSYLPHFESKWLKSVRQFLRTIQGKLRLDTPFVPEIQRVNDSFSWTISSREGIFQPPKFAG